jgi:pimeloyl-ACP methyl ester carboxylesterase
VRARLRHRLRRPGWLLLLVVPLAATWTSAAAGKAPILRFVRAPSGAYRLAKLPVRRIRFLYRTHDGRLRDALLLLPGWYGPHHDPPIPLVISPHGRNTLPVSDARRWSDLPARGDFAVVLPAGQGRVLGLYSWGYPGQIDDLARMPQLIRKAVPWFHYLRRRVYAVGASMGGQEALLLLAHAPRLLAGVIAFDPAVDLANRYDEFPRIPQGLSEQERCRIEVGGTPQQVPRAYRLRSPITYVREIARSDVPLELWWSVRDNVIVNQPTQAGSFYRKIEQINPEAPVLAVVGAWHHAGEDGADYRLPYALARLGLLPPYWLHHNPYRWRHPHGAIVTATSSVAASPPRS